MKLCQTCGEGISVFGNTVLTCSLCDARFCSGCEKTFRKQPRTPKDHVLCRKCFREFDEDEVIGIEIHCPDCHKDYFLPRGKTFACRCGKWFGASDGTPAKRIVLSCPECERELDPFRDRLLSCVLCGEMFCSQCESTFRLASRGDGIFPLCKECHSSLGDGETVQLRVVCENCKDSFTFFDPSKGSTLHGERMRLNDPFPVRCKCDTFHDSEEGSATRVSVIIGWDEEIVIRENSGTDRRKAEDDGSEGMEGGILMPKGWMTPGGTVLPDGDSIDDKDLIPVEGDANDDDPIHTGLCSTCGSPVSRNAKFCNQCGTRVGALSGDSNPMRSVPVKPVPMGSVPMSSDPTESEEELIPDDDDPDGDDEELEEIIDDEEDDMCECENCRSLIPEDAIVCPICGAQFED
jgi:hypothetical protein